MSTPYDTVKFLPWVTVIVSVKINNVELTVTVDHHITDMVVAMLVHLRSVFEQMTVFIYVVDKCLSIFVLDGTLAVLLDFIIHFTIKTDFPIFLRCRRRNGMYLAKNTTSFQAIYILLGIRIA